MRYEFTIEGMSCDHCVRAVDQALRAVPGVSKVEVEVGHAVIETDAELPPGALSTAIEAEGYRPQPAA